MTWDFLFNLVLHSEKNVGIISKLIACKNYIFVDKNQSQKNVLRAFNKKNLSLSV